MSCPTGVLLLHALQQHVLQVFTLRKEVWLADYMSGSSTISSLVPRPHPLTRRNVSRREARAGGARDYTISARGGSASIRILYTYVTSSGDIRYDNRSYAVVVQRKSCARRQISAPSVPSCVHANDLSFKRCVFQVVKGPHSCRDCCYCSRRYVRTL